MKIIILYNPNSTGDSKKNAEDLVAQLRAQKNSTFEINILATKHAGHAEEIAAKYAKTGEEILLVSSSGDGGYHELINGALSDEKSQVITGLLPSGNANDHHSAIGSKDIAKDIKAQKFQRIDTIQVKGTVKGKSWTRYAHSYASIGVSAKAAHELTEQRPNAVTEKWLVAKSLITLKPVKIIVGGKEKRYSSMAFSNIKHMSKVIKLSENASVNDGKFELNSIRYSTLARLIAYLFRAVTKGLNEHQSVDTFQFTTTKQLLIQMDGEVYTLDAHSDVTVRCIKQNLTCVV